MRKQSLAGTVLTATNPGFCFELIVEEVEMQNDILVIGGGPAGLAAGIAARAKGFDVTVVDALRPPIDKACGEGILPAGVAALQRLGVRLSSEDVFPLRGVRFLDRECSFETRFQSGCGIAIRRTRLHALLAGRAAEIGVRLQWGTHVANGSKPPSWRWIVGADGHGSTVRRDAGLDASSRQTTRFGFRRHYRIPPWTDHVEIYWGSNFQIYVTPVSPSEIGIAMLSRDSRLRLSSAIGEFPELGRRLERAEPSSRDRGAVTVSRRLRHVFRGRTVLVGDASGSVDAIAGEGLSLSFRQALALSESLCSGDLASYQAEHSRLARRPALVAKLLLSLDRFPSLRQTALKLLTFGSPIGQQLRIRSCWIA
jgi:menaquinone-9 beta-reductase